MSCSIPICEVKQDFLPQRHSWDTCRTAHGQQISAFHAEVLQFLANNSVYSLIVPPALARRTRRKLLLIDAAAEIAFLRVAPGNRLEKLKGNRAGQWSVRLNDQYRICFVFRSGDAYQVEIVDYH